MFFRYRDAIVQFLVIQKNTEKKMTTEKIALSYNIKCEFGEV